MEVINNFQNTIEICLMLRHTLPVLREIEMEIFYQVHYNLEGHVRIYLHRIEVEVDQVAKNKNGQTVWLLVIQ